MTPVGRRELLAITGVGGVGLLGGWYAISERRGEARLERQLPADLDVLYIESDTEHVLSAESEESYGMIRWGVGGILRMESGGALHITDSTNQ